jgi:hypothetical protein
MRATFALCAIALVGTLLAVGCGGAGPVSPQDGREAADRRPAPADDPCYPNLTPC